MTTQPEPINHNELRRMLCELMEDLVDEFYVFTEADTYTFDDRKAGIKKRLFRTIEGIRLDGDDS